MENVLITPHIAGPSFGGNAEVQDMIWNICMENMERYLNRKKIKKYCPVKGWVLNKKDSYKLLLINCEAVIGYEQVAKRIAFIRLTKNTFMDI